MSGTQILRLLTGVQALLADAGPGSSTDPSFPHAWACLTDLVDLCAGRLLEEQFDASGDAAAEVELFAVHLNRVTRVGRDAPFTVPDRVLQQCTAMGRFLETTNELAELHAFLISVPSVIASLSGYLSRTIGRQTAPLVEVMDLAIRAGGLHQDCLERALPPI